VSEPNPADIAMLEAQLREVEQQRDNALDLVVKREAELQECLTDIVGLEGAVSDVAKEVDDLQKLFGMVLSKRRERV